MNHFKEVVHIKIAYSSTLIMDILHIFKIFTISWERDIFHVHTELTSRNKVQLLS